jgi:hypothetical protein
MVFIHKMIPLVQTTAADTLMEKKFRVFARVGFSAIAADDVAVMTQRQLVASSHLSQ